MQKTAYFTAIEQAETELKSLVREHSELLKRIEALRNFINSGKAITGQQPHAAESASLFAAPSNGDQRQPVVYAASRAPLADRLTAILRAAGRPMHLNEILRVMAQERPLKGKAPEKSVWVALNRHKVRFRRTAPNTYDLTEQEKRVQ